MGTTLRSVEDLLAGKHSNSMVLVCQVLIALGITWFVNQRMKREVSMVWELRIIVYRGMRA